MKRTLQTCMICVLEAGAFACTTDHDCTKTATCPAPDAGVPGAGGGSNAEPEARAMADRAESGARGERPGSQMEDGGAASDSAGTDVNLVSVTDFDLESPADASTETVTADAATGLGDPSAIGVDAGAEEERGIANPGIHPLNFADLGEHCGENGDCDSGFCTDGVCCESACLDVCAQCDFPGAEGSCQVAETDQSCAVLTCPPSTDCRREMLVGGNCADIGQCQEEAVCEQEFVSAAAPCANGVGTCNGQGACSVPNKAPLGETCATGDDCAEGHCVVGLSGDSICCDSACDGVCQVCGADGRCAQTPADDDRCQEVTCEQADACVTYPTSLTASRCASFGTCETAATHCQATPAAVGTPCGSGLECDAGGECVLACQVGEIDCEGVCTNPNTDGDHCGATANCLGGNAGDACVNGEVCAVGSCEYPCDGGQVACGGECLDPHTDSVHCGASGDCSGANAGEECSDGKACIDGVCTVPCDPGQIACGGQCINPTSDNDHCGASGNCSGGNAGEACDGDAECISSECRSWTLEDAPFESAQGYVTLRADGDGNVVAVWWERFQEMESLWADRYLAASGAWEGAVLVEESELTVNPPNERGLAVDAAGNATVAWSEWDGEQMLTSMRVARMTSNGQWSPAETLSTADSTISAPEVAVLPDAQGMVVWGELYDSGDSATLWAMSSEGGWEQGSLSSFRGVYQLASDSAGTAMVVMAEASGDLVARRWSGTSWSLSTSIAAAGSEPFYQLSLGGDAQGNYLAVWNAGVPVQTRRFDASSGSWQTTRTFNEAGMIRASHVAKTGSAYVLWTGDDGDLWWVGWSPTTGTWSSAQTFASGTSPRLGSDQFGNVAATWFTTSAVYWSWLPEAAQEWTPARQLDGTSDLRALVVDHSGRVSAACNLVSEGRYGLCRLE